MSWKSFLLRIGDKSSEYGPSSDFKDHVETCFGALRRELEHSPDDVLAFLLQCAEQLPHKIPLYGTVVGFLNLENEDFVIKLVQNLQTDFQDALDSGSCDRVRTLMWFLTALMCSKVLQPASLVVVFETLLSSAATTVDEEKGNPSWQACADFYVTCVLSCLPWGGAELIEQVPEEIERVMAGIQACLSIRSHVSDTGLSFFEDDETGKDLAEKDFLEDLWERIQCLAIVGNLIVCPDLTFHLKPSYKTEDLQPIDRFVVEEYLLDVLLFLNGPSRKECASFMVGLPVPFRCEYLMAETIFSQLLLLPHPPFKPLYYTLVIMDLCEEEED
ncbi:hypothetical protein SLA2020_241740 [Shorea laevis]